MSDASELFPSFSERLLDTRDASIFVRIGGQGPPILLLHGYPETHAMWHRVAPRLAQSCTVIAADLRGYGRSSCPPSDPEHRAYSKRTMADEMIDVMRQLGHKQFSIMGHDRGAHVAYRLALDQPHLVVRLALLDTISPRDWWQAVDRGEGSSMSHWAFLAQPAPLPEGLIARDPVDWLEGRLKRMTKSHSLGELDQRALDEYRHSFSQSDRIHATCEDFRAGARCDRLDDEADFTAGRRIACPTLILWSSAQTEHRQRDPLTLWEQWCDDVTGRGIDAGHFMAEENPDALLEAVLPFFAQIEGSAA